MKKILTLCMAVVMAAAVSARTYQHSVGMVAGLGIGAQYKTMVMENFTILAEFGYFTCPSNVSYAGAIAHGVFAYQANILESDGIRLDYYAGGQVKSGYGNGGYGVIGVGAAGGIEANMHNAPIAFSFDFRPGYGCVLIPGTMLGGSGLYAGHMFDYSFNLGVRYTF